MDGVHLYCNMCVATVHHNIVCLQEEQRKKEHEERLDRATRSVSEEVEVCLLQWRGRGL